MAMTQQQAQQACENLDRRLATFQADPTKLPDLFQCVGMLRRLRDSYRQSGQAFAPFVDRLRQQSQAVTAALRSCREALAEEYLNASQAIAAWEQRRLACRQALSELARADNVSRFDSPAGAVEAQPMQTFSMPKTGTPERIELADIIRATGQWEALTSPTGQKILKALDDGVFTAEQAQRLKFICRIEQSFRLSAHPRTR